MVKTKTVGHEVLDVKFPFCIVRSKEVRVDENGKPYGRALVFYDVCGFDHGEIGDIYESFKTVKEAEKCMEEMGR